MVTDKKNRTYSALCGEFASILRHSGAIYGPSTTVSTQAELKEFEQFVIRKLAVLFDMMGIEDPEKPKEKKEEPKPFTPSWWVKSETDPRWTRQGTSECLAFVQGMPVEVKTALDSLMQEFGDPPKDLEWGTQGFDKRQTLVLPEE